MSEEIKRGDRLADKVALVVGAGSIQPVPATADGVRSVNGLIWALDRYT